MDCLLDRAGATFRVAQWVPRRMLNAHGGSEFRLLPRARLSTYVGLCIGDALPSDVCDGISPDLPIRCMNSSPREVLKSYAPLFGTFLPFLRASKRAIAIACLRLFTFPPRPPGPLFALPRL